MDPLINSIIKDSSWPKNGLEPVGTCPVCGSSGRECLYEGLEDVVFFSAPGKWIFYKCMDCGSGYLDPRPSLDTLHLAYRNYYTHDQTPDMPKLGLIQKARRIIANGYRNRQYGINDQPSVKLGYHLTKLMPGKRFIIDRGMRHLPTNGKDKKLLDIGCGNGAFLLRVKSAGWDVSGIDLDEQVVKSGLEKGLEIQLGDITVLKSKAAFYDVITLSHVIEHVSDPASLLKHCFRLLKPDGSLWLETPNINSTGHVLYGKHWRGLEIPRHLVVFTMDSLKKLLIELGFSQVKLKPHVPLCKPLFEASSAISNGKDPYNSDKILEIPSNMSLSEAERIARSKPEKREFLTLSAMKN